MWIQELSVENFQGLRGVHKFTFEQINALCSKNGVGKTSLMNALRYALTGHEPNGEMITKGSGRCTVSCKLENGHSYLRMKYGKRPSAYYIDGKKTTLKMLNESIEAAIGVPLPTIEIASSSELLASMNPQKFGEFILSCIHEDMNTETVLSYIDDADELTTAYVKEHLPEKEFGIEAINALESAVKADRRTLKQSIDADKMVLARIGGAQKPEGDKNALMKRFEALEKARQDAAAYVLAKKTYDQAITQKNNQKKMLDQIDAELKTLNVDEKKCQIRDTLVRKMEGQKETLRNLKSMLTQLRTNCEAFEKAIKAFDEGVCPMAKSIVCTTDRTKAKEEIRTNISATETTIRLQKEEFTKQKNAYLQMEEELKAVDGELEKWKRKNDLEEQKKKISSFVINVPEKPADFEVENTDKEFSILKAKISAFDNYEKAESIRCEMQENETKFKMLDSLAKKLNPKGIVKEKIIAYYMEAFSDVCNQSAKALNPKMHFKFVASEGVRVYVDIKGDGAYLQYSSLSGGEKAEMLFVLLEMINAQSGIKILLLDELSVLDKVAFDALIKLIVKHKDDYDLVVLSMVDHTDTVESLRKAKINVLDVTKAEKAA